MRQNVKNLVRLVFEQLPALDPVFEFGSFQVERQEGFADLRPFFQGKTYVGCDFRKGPGVDRIENIEKLTLKDETVGTALMLDTIEHIQDCAAACREIFRILRPDGIALVSSVMDFHIHAHPHDYWRFTPEAINYLMRRFPVRIIGAQGWRRKPHTVFGIGLKRDDLPALELRPFADSLRAGMEIERSFSRRAKFALARLLSRKMQIFQAENEFLMRLYIGEKLQEEIQLD